MPSPRMKTIVFDPEMGIKGYVVVDTFLNGQAMGGTRIAPGVTLAEISRLASAMSLKLALAGVPIGGSKAGLNCSLPPGPKRDDAIARFGELVAPLLNGGVYMGTDLGCSFDDRQRFHDSAGYSVPTPKDFPCTWAEYWRNCGEITGHGAFESCMAFIDSSTRLTSAKKVVVQGFGKAGQSAAKRFSEIGYKVVAIADIAGTIFCQEGLDIKAVMHCTDASGTIQRSLLPKNYVKLEGKMDWLSLECDILVLAARGDTIHEGNCGQVRASVILEAANHPVTTFAQLSLHKRGIAVIPDILANCGSAAITGIILLKQTPKNSTLQNLVSWTFELVSQTVRENMRNVAARARKQNIGLPAAALEIAQEKRQEIFGASTEIQKAS